MKYLLVILFLGGLCGGIGLCIYCAKVLICNLKENKKEPFGRKIILPAIGIVVGLIMIILAGKISTAQSNKVRPYQNDLDAEGLLITYDSRKAVKKLSFKTWSWDYGMFYSKARLDVDDLNGEITTYFAMSIDNLEGEGDEYKVVIITSCPDTVSISNESWNKIRKDWLDGKIKIPPEEQIKFHVYLTEIRWTKKLMHSKK